MPCRKELYSKELRRHSGAGEAKSSGEGLKDRRRLVKRLRFSFPPVQL
jgi:hypothetical protein